MFDACKGVLLNSVLPILPLSKRVEAGCCENPLPDNFLHLIGQQATARSWGSSCRPRRTVGLTTCPGCYDAAVTRITHSIHKSELPLLTLNTVQVTKATHIIFRSASTARSTYSARTSPHGSRLAVSDIIALAISRCLLSATL